MTTWERQINNDHIRFVNQSHVDHGGPDWAATDHTAINLSAVYAVEVHEDTRGPFVYVYYSPTSAASTMPDLTLQLTPAERLIRALLQRTAHASPLTTC